MNHRAYEYVSTIAREGSFSRAARVLYITQPALSAAVKKLEEELCGVSLFDRTVTPVKLTPAGKFYLEKAGEIDRLEQEIQAHFAALSGRINGKLTIGSASFFCTYVLPDILRRYQDLNPEAEVHMSETGARAEEALFNGELDLVMDVEQLDQSRFETIRLDREYVLVAVPATFPVNESLKEYRLTQEQIADRSFLKEQVPRLPLSLLKEEPFLLLKDNNDMCRRAMEMCGRAGFDPRVALRTDQMLTAWNIARAGQTGVTFFRDTILRYTEPTDRLCYYYPDDELAERDILLSWKRFPGLTPLGEDFVRFLMLVRKGR